MLENTENPDDVINIDFQVFCHTISIVSKRIPFLRHLTRAYVSFLFFAFFDGVKRGWKFVEFLILLEGYRIWDMVFLDYLLLTKSRFFQRYYPEI